MGPAPGTYATNREPLTPEERDAARRRRENTPPWTDVPKAMLEMYAAALRGVTKATLGTPGEIEDIFPRRENPVPADNWRYLGGMLKKPTGRVFPTMKEVGEMLPPLHPRDLSSLVAEEPENPYETLGSFAPVGPKTVGQLGRAVGEGVRGIGGVTRSALSEVLRPSTPRLQIGAINPRGVKLGKLEEVLKTGEAPMLPPSSESGAILPRAPGGGEAQFIPAEQAPIPRVTDLGREPKMNERSLALGRSKRAASAVDELIAKGRTINPELEHWYGAEPLRQFALNEGLSQQEFERMLAHLSSASQRNPVTKENMLGSYLWGMERRGEFSPESQLFTNKRALDEGMRPTDPGVVSLPPGLGSISQSPIFYRAKDLALGKPPEEAFGPKMWSYYRNKLGNEVPVTVDVNAIHGPVMKGGLTDWLKTLSVNKDNEGRIVSSFTPLSDYEKGKLTLKAARARPGFWTDAPKTAGEYKALEDLWTQGANRAGVTPAGGQALGWYGSGDITALQTQPKTYMELIEQGARAAAARLGVTPVEAMRGAIQGKRGYQLGRSNVPFVAGLAGAGGLGLMGLAISKALRKKKPQAQAQAPKEGAAAPQEQDEQDVADKLKSFEAQNKSRLDKQIE